MLLEKSCKKKKLKKQKKLLEGTILMANVFNCFMILTYILSIKFRNSQINFDHDTYQKRKKMATISSKIGYTHIH